ncbi:MAG: DUF799 domain-containing protein [Vitreoscilla sp.]|nr:DUF799 domain-containing protein [Vitreoscilla sp.]
MTQQPQATAGARLLMGGLLLAAALLSACATRPPEPYDYTAFKASRPASLLVLPPLNQSPDVKATYGVLSQVTLPLAESGYYVVPVSLMDETFRDNGLTMAADIHAVEASKLREIFGADAAVYITVKNYGTSYNVVSGDAVVVLDAKIVDLRNGALLWQGSASASSGENKGSNQGGLVGLLVQAIVSQVLNSATDMSFKVANVANNRLLSLHRVNGVLPGPRYVAPKKE